MEPMSAEFSREIREKVHPAVRDLIALAEERQLGEVAWESDGVAIRIQRNPSARPAAPPLEAGRAPIHDEAPEARMLAVHSGLVGVFRTAGPTRVPRVGEPVNEGQVLAWIESMRLMNEVNAPRGGRLAEILVEDGHAVEYGQPLAVLEVHT
ncbi:MAG: acetyl-CoA carboxylase biotin carboxyl carrier protein [Armatimonadetes bacterium]|nr:acetyl-CoA carboxylase biotin carboxyl carrier protein [Armatimonadota bacterium]